MYSGHEIKRGHRAERGLVAFALVLAIGLAAPAVARAAPMGAFEQEQDPESLYQEALALNLQGEWARALPLFQQIAAGSSARAPEAAFYAGLCLENLPERQVEAFEAFVDLRERFPESTFAARALSHQVTLAGQLGRDDTFYRDFLMYQIDNGERPVRYEAVLSLAGLGDERARSGLVEVLRNGSNDQKMLALERIPAFPPEIATSLANQAVRITRGSGLNVQALDLRTSLAAQQAERDRLEDMIATDRRFLMNMIKREGEEWTEAELITQGLFHIMPVETFARYIQADPAERREIYTGYWRTVEDPFPDTPVQEAEAEFRLRIDYARAHFSEPWKSARSLYEAADWLTADNAYAAWDARGELFIKYGEPDAISMVGFNVEEWLYTRFRIDFTVMKYKVNFFRNAIYPGRSSQMDFGSDIVQTNFINAPRYEYWPTRWRRP
jgi:hypothetical protein